MALLKRGDAFGNTLIPGDVVQATRSSPVPIDRSADYILDLFQAYKLRCTASNSFVASGAGCRRPRPSSNSFSFVANWILTQPPA
jgi:hypothetical protein